MTNEKMHKAYIYEAELRLKTATQALANGDFAYAVRQCQEAIELCLKGALRLVGIEPPKWYDVGKILKDNRKMFPDRFQAKIDLFAHYSLDLGEKRAKSFYGDEDKDMPPQEIFSKIDADEAVKAAKEIMTDCKKLA